MSWPADIDLRPTYYFLTVAAISLGISCVGGCFTLLHLKRPSITSMEILVAMLGIVLLIMWIAADFLEGHSEKTPEKNMLDWACRRNGSPTNVLVRYSSICQEQVGLPVL